MRLASPHRGPHALAIAFGLALVAAEFAVAADEDAVASGQTVTLSKDFKPLAGLPQNTEVMFVLLPAAK